MRRNVRQGRGFPRVHGGGSGRIQGNNVRVRSEVRCSELRLPPAGVHETAVKGGG